MKLYRWTASRPIGPMHMGGEYLVVMVLANDLEEAEKIAMESLKESGYTTPFAWDGRKFEVIDEPSIVYAGVR